MILIFTLDDNNGLLFNHRRQSRDEAVTKDILALTEGRTLCMSPYSARLFHSARITVSEDCLQTAGAGEYCFAEQAVEPGQAERLIVYRWNRVYPADTRVTIDPLIWHLTERREFVGKSHDTVTVEVYDR